MDKYLSDLKEKIPEYKENLESSLSDLEKVRREARKYIDLYQVGSNTLKQCKEENNKLQVRLKLKDLQEKLKQIKEEMDVVKKRVEYSELIFNSCASEVESLELLMSLPDTD